MWLPPMPTTAGPTKCFISLALPLLPRKWASPPRNWRMRLPLGLSSTDNGWWWRMTLAISLPAFTYGLHPREREFTLCSGTRQMMRQPYLSLCVLQSRPAPKLLADAWLMWSQDAGIASISRLKTYGLSIIESCTLVLVFTHPWTFTFWMYVKCFFGTNWPCIQQNGGIGSVVSSTLLHRPSASISRREEDNHR